MSNEMKSWVEEFNTLNPIEQQPTATKRGKKSSEPKTGPDYTEILRHLDAQDKNFYSGLTDKEKAGVSLWVFMRAMSSGKHNPEHYLLMVNDLVNVNFTNISHHPELQWKLLALCGRGPANHPWLAPPKKLKKNRLEEQLLKLNPLLKDDELEMLQKLNTPADFKSYFKSCGMSDDEIAKVIENDL